MKKLACFLVLLFTFVEHSVAMQEKYLKNANCGTATVIEGDSCDKIKVQFEFTGCLLKSEAKPATKISCEGNLLKARHQNGNIRYEALFTKTEKGWGGTGWKPVGVVSEWQKAGGRGFARETASAPSRAKKAAKSKPFSKPAASDGPHW